MFVQGQGITDVRREIICDLSMKSRDETKNQVKRRSQVKYDTETSLNILDAL